VFATYGYAAALQAAESFPGQLFAAADRFLEKPRELPPKRGQKHVWPQKRQYPPVEKGYTEPVRGLSYAVREQERAVFVSKNA